MATEFLAPINNTDFELGLGTVPNSTVDATTARRYTSYLAEGIGAEQHELVCAVSTVKTSAWVKGTYFAASRWSTESGHRPTLPRPKALSECVWLPGPVERLHKGRSRRNVTLTRTLLRTRSQVSARCCILPRCWLRAPAYIHCRVDLPDGRVVHGGASTRN